MSTQPVTTSKTYTKLRVSKELVRRTTRYYLKARVLSRLRPVAWVTSGAPVEILVAMGILPLYPENYGAICGARKVAADLCRVAEAQGYSQDLCSYATSHIGSVLDPKLAPMGGLPRPDLLVACSNICGTVLKWYQALADHFNIPLFVVDAPFVHQGQLRPHMVSYVVDQLKELIAWCEHHTGRRLREKKFLETLALANEAVRLWREIRELCVNRPSPLNAPDLFTQMAPIVVWRGTRDAVDYYRKLKAEVEERVANGVGAIPAGERYRLLWDNIAIWYALFRFYRQFSQAGACFVVDTYTNAWSMSVDTTDPLEGLAQAYTTVYINLGLPARTRLMLDLAQRFQVDGVVMHSNRSCKPYSFGQYVMRRQVSERLGLPVLIIEADMADSRNYAEGAISNQVQAFLEMLR